MSGLPQVNRRGDARVSSIPVSITDCCRVQLTADQSIPSGNVLTALSGFTVQYDPTGAYSAGSPDRLTIKNGGLKTIFANIKANNDGASFRWDGWIELVSTSGIIGRFLQPSMIVLTEGFCIYTSYKATANDQIRLQVRQGGIAAHNVLAGAWTAFGFSSLQGDP